LFGENLKRVKAVEKEKNKNGLPDFFSSTRGGPD
jgi:hypothetical protein